MITAFTYIIFWIGLCSYTYSIKEYCTFSWLDSNCLNIGEYRTDLKIFFMLYEEQFCYVSLIVEMFTLLIVERPLIGIDLSAVDKLESCLLKSSEFVMV
jgi:hypothetical protein